MLRYTNVMKIELAIDMFSASDEKISRSKEGPRIGPPATVGGRLTEISHGWSDSNDRTRIVFCYQVKIFTLAVTSSKIANSTWVTEGLKTQR